MILRASVGTAMMIIDVLRDARRTARVGAGLAKTLCARPDALLLKSYPVFPYTSCAHQAQCSDALNPPMGGSITPLAFSLAQTGLPSSNGARNTRFLEAYGVGASPKHFVAWDVRSLPNGCAM